MERTRRWIFPLFGGALLACGPAPRAAPPPAPAPVAVTPAYFRRTEPPAGPGAGAELPVVAARVFALGDTQFHHMYGKRTFAQSPFADRASFEVAVRPAALDDGSDLLLEAFLAERRARYRQHTLVYMGDAADVSCEQEYARFHEVMDAAGELPLLMVTSNHDGFFAGNFTSKADLDGLLAATDMPEDWTRACAEPGSTGDHRLTRGKAIAAIAAALPGAPAWATELASEDVDSPGAYRRSWLAFVRPLGGGDAGAPPAWGVFIDTSDYRGFDLEASKGAGTWGAVAQEQLVALDRAMFAARDEAGARPRWIAFGHSPTAGLESASRARLLKFLDTHPEIVAYVSAHTHISDERRLVLPSGRELPEIVVGSTTDWPQEARVIELRVAEDGGAAGVASWRLGVDLDALCEGVPALDPDSLGYLGYRLVRDDVPDLTIGTLEGLAFYFGLDDLAQKRAAQTLGALLVENELVRALAYLYASAPGGAEHDELASIVKQRFPAGATLGELSDAVEHDQPGFDDFEIWIDPVLSPVVPMVSRHLWSFGGRRALFEALRRWRRDDAERRRWFACHAAHAARAEAEHPRRRGTLYIP